LKRKIKLIWDFRGHEALKIAEHHCEHLNQFITNENLDCYEIDVNQISQIYCIAYIIVDEQDMITFRDALKPHRGEIAK